jgi:hypothetical protein
MEITFIPKEEHLQQIESAMVIYKLVKIVNPTKIKIRLNPCHLWLKNSNH